MKRLKSILKTVFCPPPLPTILLAAFGFGLILAVVAFHIQNPVVVYASYLSSAYALIISITGLKYLKLAKQHVKKAVSNHALMKKIRSTAIGEKFLTDIRFRTWVSLGQGLLINILYIVMKLVSGIYYRSVWLISLAGYYMLLALLRSLLVRHVNVRDEAVEFRRYRLCGFILLIMNQALTGIVIFMVHQNKGFDYPGLLIYAMAFYAFYAVITATVNVVKTRRHQSPILSAAKAINLVAALVSILSLTTAMLAQFGGDDDPAFRKTMTGAVGGGVCTIVIGMAIYMIWRANRNLKKLQINNSQT